MSALAPVVRIGGAIIGITLFHAAFLTGRPALGLWGIGVAVCAAVVANICFWKNAGRPIWLAGFAILFGVALQLDAESSLRYFLIAIPILVHLGLAVLFGQSLLPGRTPLITCFSRVERAPVIDPVIESYTRSITWIWVLYFVAIGLIAAGLVLAGELTAASWVTSVLSPAVGFVLFGGEHLHRYLRPGVFGPTSVIRTFRSMANPDAWRLAKQRG